MKNITLILLYILVTASNTWGQSTPTPMGAKNGTVEALGGFKVDSALKLPIVAITARFTKGGLDTNGYIFSASTDSLPRFMKKGHVVRMYTDYDTTTTVATRAYTNTRIQQLIDDTSLTIAELGFGLIRVDTVLLIDSSKIATYNYVNRTFLRTSDTTSLSTRINTRQNFTDTSGWDATKSYVVTAISGKMNYSDTASLSNRINLKLNSSDTASLSNRINLKLSGADTVALSNRINLKLNSSDTTGLSSRINTKQNFTDTTTWDATKANLVTKVNYSDTAFVIATQSGLNLKLNSADTAGLSSRINLKLNSSDTAGLSSRINLKQNFTDTTTWDATKKNLKDTATALRALIGGGSGTFVPYTGANQAVDLNTQILTSGVTNINGPTSTGGALNIAGNVLAVSGGATPISLTNPLADFETSVNAVAQINIRNASNGTGASGDLVVTADNGTDAIHYVDMGVNSSGYSVGTWTINGADDGYFYDMSDNLSIGTATAAKYLNFFTGGTLAANERMRIDGSGNTTIVRDIQVDSVDIGSGNASSTNVRFGKGALPAVTTGASNVAIGPRALEDITVGNGNIAIGDRAIGATTSASVTASVAIGLTSQQNATGSSNTSVGWQSASAASYSSSFGAYFGALSGAALTSGGANTFYGYTSGSAITSGGSNTILGPWTGNSGGLDIRTSSNRVVITDGAPNIRMLFGSTGNGIIGSVTDNGTDKFQLTGSMAISSLPTGVAADLRMTWNSSTLQEHSVTAMATVTATGNTTSSVPSQTQLMSVTIVPVGTETIQGGTTNGGVDLFAPTVFTAGTLTTVTINKILATGGATTIFLNGAVGSVTYYVKQY